MTAGTIDSARFLAPRQPMYRSLGVPVPEGLTDTDKILAHCGLDFEYVTTPLRYQTPDGGGYQSDWQAVLRTPYAKDPEWREMGIVGPKYTYLQNRDMLRGLKHLQEQTGWTLDTLGTVDSGKGIFMVLKAEERQIFGDQLQTSIILHEGKAQHRALHISVVPLRLYCLNQLVSGRYDMISISHRPDLPQEFAFWTKLLGKLQKQQTEVYTQLEAMASVHITDEQARSIIERAYPMPRVSPRMSNLLRVSATPGLDQESRAEIRKAMDEAAGTQRNVREQVANRRRNAFALYERFNANDEQAIRNGAETIPIEIMNTLAKTPYAVLQAVTELVDWGGQAPATIAAGSALWGQGANVKMRAWRSCLDHTK